MSNPVNHPSHYNAGKVECIDALEAATIGLVGIEAVCTASAIKYLWRWKLKGGLEDLQKARWYLDRLIAANLPAPVPIESKIVNCLKCGGRWHASKLNSEGWCFDCFSAPTNAVATRCLALWEDSTRHREWQCGNSPGHAGQHLAVDPHFGEVRW